MAIATAEIGNLTPRHLLSATDFVANELEKQLFPLTDNLKKRIGNGPNLKHLDLLSRDFSVMVFMEEPSTRTGPSMHRAASLLNASSTILTNADTATGLAKLESRPSVARMWQAHGYNLVGWRAAQEGVFKEIVADDSLTYSLINLGDGPGEHPTQFLQDAYTMRQKRAEQGKEMENMTVIIAGMPISRVTQSWMLGFANQYAHRNITFHLVSHPDLVPSDERLRQITKEGVKVVHSTDLLSAVQNPDLAFVCGTRYQAQHDHKYADIADLSQRVAVARKEYQLHKSDLTAEVLEVLPSQVFYLHPLPNGPELPEKFQNHPQVLAFTTQARNGLYTRAALILDWADPELAEAIS